MYKIINIFTKTLKILVFYFIYAKIVSVLCEKGKKMYKIKSSAVFYSKNSNIILAKKVKESLDKIKVYTLYLNEIDDVILKKYSEITFLVLDFTNNILDDRSLELLVKLKNEGFIKFIIVISKMDYNFSNKIDLVLSFDEIETKLVEFVSSSNNSNITNHYDCNWIKIVGNFLVEIGLSTRQCGYLIMVDSIIFYIATNSYIKNLNKTLYPYLSNKYLISIPSIEMRLRTVIKSAYNKNKLNGFFSKNPTIREFINFSLTQVYSKIYSKEVII